MTNDGRGAHTIILKWIVAAREFSQGAPQHPLVHPPVLKSYISWDITLALPPAFTLVYCSAYSSTLKMEATYSYETPVDFQRTTRRYIAKDRTPQNHRCGNLRSYQSGCIVCRPVNTCFCIRLYSVYPPLSPPLPPPVLCS
jgi:hypothetical protein